MKIYKVLKYFIDKDGTPYYKGDIYPYRNEEFITEEHIDYLSSNKNKLGEPLIELEDNPKQEVEEKDEVMEVENDKPQRKRNSKISKTKTGDK